MARSRLVAFGARLYSGRKRAPREETPPVIVKQVWTGNAYRNFNYLIACSESG